MKTINDHKNTHDQSEIDKFNNLAHEWWDKTGQFKTLHSINKPRTEFIKNLTNLKDINVLDVGCGGGILTEELAKCGAIANGIDLAPQVIEIAKLHLYESMLNINYECIEIGEKAKQYPSSFDLITCMEMLEHVPDPKYIINQCSNLLKPNGIAVFSTLNRNVKCYLQAILAAEYILKIVPKGTHSYQKFIKPAELSLMAREFGLHTIAIKGVSYNPFTEKSELTSNTDVNYMIAVQKLN